MRSRFGLLSLILIFMTLFGGVAIAKSKVAVGAKKFTESYILAEIICQWLEFNNYEVERKFPMAGTIIAYHALKVNDIQIYPDYTGTIALNVLKAGRDLSLSEINRGLRADGLEMLSSFGFNNTYALAVSAAWAKNHQVTKLSDLARKSFKLGLDHEFHSREDGWRPLAKAYGLVPKLEVMEHGLIYQAIKNNILDAMIVYSTDAKIKTLGLKVLEDDKQFFPKYLSAPLVRRDLSPVLKQLVMELTGKFDEATMISLNAAVELNGQSIAAVAGDFLVANGLIDEAQKVIEKNKWAEASEYSGLWKLLLQHLVLTFLPILMGIIVALPLAVLLIHRESLAKSVLAFVGLLQTIPSLAMLVFMIWVFEAVGFLPAIVALFLYSLLPILRSSYVALKNIDPVLIKAAKGIGLSDREILFSIRFPLGKPVFISGVRVAGVINVGMATIAAFIGAGGLGQPIVTGLSLNDTGLILMGAIPAAMLAIAIELGFNYLEKKWI